MIIPHRIFNPDGTYEDTEKEVPDNYFDSFYAAYVPTTEERLAALEGAMLAMMGVNPDV